MDPGNWATDLAGGAKFGYALLWVILLSNLMAMFLQTLCVRLGNAGGRDLAQACRDQYPKPVVVPTIPNAEAFYIALGILGATVMPHNLYPHTALV